MTILDLRGKYTIHQGCEDLRLAVQGALSHGASKILLNLRDVTQFESSFFSELVTALTTTRTHGAGLRLCCIPAKVAQVLTLTQLDTAFEIFGTEEEALRSFA